MATRHHLDEQGVASSIVLGFQTEDEIQLEFVIIPESLYEDWKKDELRSKIMDIKELITS